MLKKNKLTLKKVKFTYNEDQKILKHILNKFNKKNPNRTIILNRSNNPIMLNKKDLIIIIRKILET